MRKYLVVIDESEESALALRFAARRASRTGGRMVVLAVVEPQAFVAFGGVQATIEEEARQRAEALALEAAGTVSAENAIEPTILVRQGKAAEVVRVLMSEDPDIAALVLGAAKSGNPGPLVAHFTGSEAGSLPCPVMIIPGALTEEDIDRQS